MRILTYNIHGCVGLDFREDPKRILEIIRDANADIVGLQEVYHHDALDRSFLRALEELPYATVIYGKTMRKTSADYGNLLLLRDEPENIERIELPSNGGEPRGAIIADTHCDGKPLRIIVTHLSLGFSQRKRQTAALLKHLPPESPDTRCILMGDLNEWLPVLPYFRKFCSHFDIISSSRTFPVRPTLIALDRIALRGSFRDCRFRVGDSPAAKIASDHRPLIAEVALK